MADDSVECDERGRCRLSWFIVYASLGGGSGAHVGRGKGVGEGQCSRRQGEGAGEKREGVFIHEVPGIRLLAGVGRGGGGGGAEPGARKGRGKGRGGGTPRGSVGWGGGKVRGPQSTQ